MNNFPDETVDYWRAFSFETLASTAATLHRDRRAYEARIGYHEVMGARQLVSNAFITGVGIEVGAGNRPFPVPEGVKVLYGDIRDGQSLEVHFADKKVSFDDEIDAETFAAIPLESIDFIISAHVIEHLYNPFGSIREGLRRLKANGVYVIVVPDMQYTTDRNRKATTFEHLIDDMKDGGKSTLLQSYLEHCEHVHPLSQEAFSSDELIKAAQSGMENRVDIHVHTWTKDSFKDHLSRLSKAFGFEIVFSSNIQNEAVFVLRKP